jgi:GTP-binding protein
MIVGEHAKDTELFVNPTKEKKLSNMRASGKDQNITLTPVIPMTIEKAIEFIEDDEMVEITPENIRLRKVDLSAKQERKNKKG